MSIKVEDVLALSGGGRTVELLVRRDTMHNRSILTKVPNIQKVCIIRIYRFIF